MFNKLAKPFLTSISKNGAIPAELVESLNTVVKAAADYGKVVEEEKTKREQILANRDVAIAQIHAQRDVLLSYFQETFRERAKVLDESFRVLDRALEKGDVNAMDKALNIIVNTVKHSPFKDVADMQKKLNDESFVLKLE